MITENCQLCNKITVVALERCIGCNKRMCGYCLKNHKCKEVTNVSIPEIKKSIKESMEKVKDYKDHLMFSNHRFEVDLDVLLSTLNMCYTFFIDKIESFEA